MVSHLSVRSIRNLLPGNPSCSLLHSPLRIKLFNSGLYGDTFCEPRTLLYYNLNTLHIPHGFIKYFYTSTLKNKIKLRNFILLTFLPHTTCNFGNSLGDSHIFIYFCIIRQAIPKRSKHICWDELGRCYGSCCNLAFVAIRHLQWPSAIFYLNWWLQSCVSNIRHTTQARLAILRTPATHSCLLGTFPSSVIWFQVSYQWNGPISPPGRLARLNKMVKGREFGELIWK